MREGGKHVQFSVGNNCTVVAPAMCNSAKVKTVLQVVFEFFGTTNYSQHLHKHSCLQKIFRIITTDEQSQEMYNIAGTL